jgi:hypothetical protein
MNVLKFLLIVVFAWLFVNCGEDTESRDNVPPQTPVMRPRSDDAVYPQEGVRAEATTNDRNYWTRIEWFRNPETDVQSYRVRRWSEQVSSDDAPIVADLALNVDLIDDFVLYWIDRGDDQFGGPVNLLAPNDQGLTRGYWWQVQAVDTAGNRSEWSDSVYFRMIYNAYNLSVVGSGDNVRLTWSYPIGGPSTYLSFYKIRVYSNWYGRDSLIWDYQVQLYGQNNSVLVGSEGAFTPMTHDCTYVWQLNAVSYVASDTNDVALAGSAMYRTFKYSQ